MMTARMETSTHSAARGESPVRSRTIVTLSLVLNLVLITGSLAAPTGGAWEQAQQSTITANPASTQPASNQPASDGGSELKNRVAALEAENAALKKRLRDMQSQLDRLGRSTGGPGAAQVNRADVPRDPFAAPASLYVELQRRYQRDLGDLPRNTRPQIENLMRHTEKWAAATNQELRGRTRWLLDIGEIYEIDAGKHEAVVTVLDDGTFAPIGNSFRAEVPLRFVDRVRSMQRAHRLEARRERDTALAWDLQLTVEADLRFLPDTPDAGLFNAVTLVGSYVEFGFKLQWQGLTDVEIPTSPTPGEAPASSNPAVKPTPRPSEPPR